MTTLKATAPTARAMPSLQAQDAGRQDDGQHVDGRAGVEERGGRPQPRAHALDAREQRQHGAGADRQDRARDRRHAVGQHLVRLRARGTSSPTPG